MEEVNTTSKNLGVGRCNVIPSWENVCGTEITIMVSNFTGGVWATDPKLNGGGD